MLETRLGPPTSPLHRTDAAYPTSDLDLLLTAQIVVAWAGEGGEQPRLRWWHSNLVSEMGGEDLFQQLLPVTWDWSVLQAVRACAIRCDAALRARDHAPDTILSLSAQGVVIDELTDERVRALKRSGVAPTRALPGLADWIGTPWERSRFSDWSVDAGGIDRAPTPIGRLVKGPVPQGLDQCVRRLVGALRPLGDAYPLRHYRRAA
jgi:hypothetical protein